MSDPRFLDGWLHSRPEPRHSNSLQVRLDAPDGITYAPDQTDPHTASRRLFVVPPLPEPASSLYSFQDEIIGYERATQKSVFVIGEDECDPETDAQKFAANYRTGNLQSRQPDLGDCDLEALDSDDANSVAKTIQNSVATSDLEAVEEKDIAQPTQQCDGRSEDASKSRAVSESGDKESEKSQDAVNKTIESETTAGTKLEQGFSSRSDSQTSVVYDEDQLKASPTDGSKAVSTSEDQKAFATQESKGSVKEHDSKEGDDAVSTTSRESVPDGDLVSESQNGHLAEDEPSEKAHGNNVPDETEEKYDPDGSADAFVAKSLSTKSDKNDDDKSAKSIDTSSTKSLQDSKELNEASENSSTPKKESDEFLTNKDQELESVQSAKAEIGASEPTRSQSTHRISGKQVAGTDTQKENKSREASHNNSGSPKSTIEVKDIEESVDSVDATTMQSGMTSPENRTPSLQHQASDVPEISDRENSVSRGLEMPHNESHSSLASSQDAALNRSKNEKATDSVAEDVQKPSVAPEQRSLVRDSTEAEDSASLRSARSHAPSCAPSVAPTISRMTLESSMRHSKTPVLPKPVRENFTEYSFRPPASQLGKQYTTHVWDAPKYTTLRATESLAHQPEGNDAGSQWERVSGYNQSGPFQPDAQIDISQDTISELFIADPRKWHPYRFVRRTDPRQLLLLVAGQCLSEEQVQAAISKRESASKNTINTNSNSDRPLASYFGTLENSQAQGGIGVVFSPSRSLCESMKQPFDQHRAETNLSRRLEQPEFPNTTTTQRAALRSVIAALEYVQWEKEGFDKLVIAVHNAWIVRGISHDIWTWRKNGWVLTRKTPQGFPGEQVPNRDLWELLDYLVRQWEDIE
ncbi:hypothetical protein MYAM1_001184 [Malassezia yamatoensis]|uniref:RNase H type-1 domain-containing protein n=1 Tax=Malassezia yamatoensis TaxID=253288 RepID=A0AAJ6CI39_9BASI|nr:hypothetical protein MYAM1_001184 [Malassezia yamatoensis]